VSEVGIKSREGVAFVEQTHGKLFTPLHDIGSEWITNISDSSDSIVCLKRVYLTSLLSSWKSHRVLSREDENKSIAFRRQG
jgi:hypothetical protein